MQQNKLKFGIVTFWTLGPASLARLREGLTRVGLDKYVPDEATPLNSLRHALAAVYPDCLIRRLRRRGFCAVTEGKGDDANDYGFVASAWLEGEDLDLAFHPSVPPDVQKQIAQAYCASRDTIGGAQLGQVLSRVVMSELGGTALRPSGGVYWLQDTRLEAWQQVATAVECSAAADGKCSVYLLRNEVDADAVRAIRDAIVTEMHAEAERLGAEILGGELGGRALEHRSREAHALIAKLREYEGFLGSLDEVRRRLEDVEQTAATAALLSAGEQEQQPALIA